MFSLLRHLFVVLVGGVIDSIMLIIYNHIILLDNVHTDTAITAPIFKFFNFKLNTLPLSCGACRTLHDTFRVCHPKRKSCIFAVGFLVPSRDKHHDICDLRCLVAGNIAKRSVNIMRCPCLGTFPFPLRHRSVAHCGGALPNEVVLL